MTFELRYICTVPLSGRSKGSLDSASTFSGGHLLGSESVANGLSPKPLLAVKYTFSLGLSSSFVPFSSRSRVTNNSLHKQKRYKKVVVGKFYSCNDILEGPRYAAQISERREFANLASYLG